MPLVTCSKFNTSQATRDQAIADLAAVPNFKK